MSYVDGTDESVVNSVRQVAQYLDDDVPNWVEVLVDAYGTNLSRMRINAINECVLAAIFDSYGDGLDRVFVARGIDPDEDSIALAVGHYWVDSVHLRAAWLIEVNARRVDT